MAERSRVAVVGSGAAIKALDIIKRKRKQERLTTCRLPLWFRILRNLHKAPGLERSDCRGPKPSKHKGDDSPENLALACLWCNLHKGTIENSGRGNSRFWAVRRSLNLWAELWDRNGVFVCRAHGYTRDRRQTLGSA